MFALRPNRGHKRDRTRPERAEKITKALKGQPDRFDKLAQEVKDRKPKKDILFMFKVVRL